MDTNQTGRVFVARVADLPPGDIRDELSDLDELTFGAAAARVAQAEEEQHLTHAIAQPVVELIRNDKAASAAFKRLTELRGNRANTSLERPSRSVASPITGLDIKPGLNFLGRPYDLERTSPTSGLGASSTADRFSGHCAASMWPPGRASAIGTAAACIGVVFHPSGPAMITARPFIRYSYQCYLMGLLAWSAFSDGTVWIAALSDQNTVLEHRELRLWSNMTETKFVQSNEGTVWPSLELRFPVRQGELYKLFVGVTVNGNQSGFPSDPLGGGSSSESSLHIDVPWIVVET